MILKKVLIFSILFFSLINLFASDNRSGHIRLTLNEKTGEFSLYYMTNPERRHYEPLFNSTEPAASFLAVNVDGRAYRLGQSKEFSTKFEKINGNPAIIYESNLLTVTMIFIPVRTANSRNTNGIRISINLENTGIKTVSVGLRMLLDTHLGEGYGSVPILTDKMAVSSETVIEGGSGEKYWISRGENISLMGSIINPMDLNARLPDYIHIANWKRLNDTRWKLRYVEGRSFNYSPYSIRDSAVCYYYEPDDLVIGQTFSYSIFLTTEDTGWYNTAAAPPQPVTPDVTPELPVVILEPALPLVSEPLTPVIEIPDIEIQEEIIYEEPAPIDEKLMNMLELQEILNKFLSGEINLNEQELLEIERAISDYHSGLY